MACAHFQTFTCARCTNARKDAAYWERENAEGCRPDAPIPPLESLGIEVRPRWAVHYPQPRT